MRLYQDDIILGIDAANPHRLQRSSPRRRRPPIERAECACAFQSRYLCLYKDRPNLDLAQSNVSTPSELILVWRHVILQNVSVPRGVRKSARIYKVTLNVFMFYIIRCIIYFIERIFILLCLIMYFRWTLNKCVKTMCITYSVMLIYESVYNKLGEFRAATLK